jgi:hypothetical protein
MRTHFAYEAEPFEAYTDFELEFEINRSSREHQVGAVVAEHVSLASLGKP